VPVSQKPRKKRAQTPPASSRRSGRSGMQRAMVAGLMGVLALGLALLTIFSLQRNEKAATKQQGDPAAKPTTTALDPTGGVPCPDKDGASDKRDTFPATGPPSCLIVGHTYKARITTDIGTFTMILDPAKAPKSVNSFVVLARYHFYDDLTFHKAVPGFFIQSGDPPAVNKTDPGYTFDDAVPADGKAYVEGGVAMANQGKGQNGSQFLILSSAAPALRPQYPLFGQVIDGIDVVKRIANDGGSNGVPAKVHRLLKVTIIESS
jgi:cyclophilin family peptidyl-prolyl cis-trans isomerase